MNCNNEECVYWRLEFLHNNDGFVYDRDYCTKENKIINDDLFDNNSWVCENFEQFKFCDTCKHGYDIFYDWDDTDYHCKLQNRKVIYRQCSSVLQNAECPKCNIDKYEEF